MLLALLSFLVGCTDPYTRTPIASSATVSKEWTEIHPTPALRWSRPVQEFTFHIDSAHQRNPKLEIIAPNGEHSVPDVELVAEDGSTFALDVHGFLNEDMFFTRRTPVTTIRSVRIRNSFPIRISNVRWVGYDPAEVKR
jgi:hypothetical protein